MLLPTSCAGCATPGFRLCPGCRGHLVPPPEGAAAPALFAYQGGAAALVSSAKYRGRRGLIGVFADELAAAVRSSGAVPAVVTWAPTGLTRRRARGFDQAELLARGVGRRLGVPARRLLVRVSGPAQTGRGRHDRLLGPTFVAVGRVPGRVLVVDDVVTTGATLAAARTALLVGGAHRVDAWAVAATPAGAPSTAPSTVPSTAA